MTYEEYMNKLSTRFKELDTIPSLNAMNFYEEKFEMKWLATKLKQFSFVSSAEYISAEIMQNYSAQCFDYALKEYQELPRGLQNGVVSFNVLVSNKIDEAAVQFSLLRPKKHFSAFEVPIIVDLSKEKIYYYQKTPIWGAIYYKHIREYIEANFII